MNENKEKKEHLTHKQSKERTKLNILRSAVRAFLEDGYANSKVTAIIKNAGCSISSFQNLFGTKEGIIPTLAEIMFTNQFAMAKSIKEKNENPIFVYVVETSIQLTLTELNETLREVYVAAYSNPQALEFIYQKTSAELEEIFSAYNPGCDRSDFYEFDIGSAGIMRGFMSRKCDQYFTLEKKIKKFITMTLRCYNVPQEEIDRAIVYVLSLDIRAISAKIMQQLFETLAMQLHFDLDEIR